MSLEAFTIIVPTKNEARNIATFLDSIPESIALIIVDASTDQTTDIIQTQRPTNTQLIRHPGNVTEARQVGAEAARTEWLVFTDADTSFAPAYFDRLARHTIHDVVYGAKLSKNDYHRYYQWFLRGQHVFHRLGIPAASGSNLVMRREALLDSGGFDLRLTVNEDSEIVWRMKRHGYSIHFDPDLVVLEHDHRRLEKGVTRKTMHSLIRGFLLYTHLMPARWRSQDWGYWVSRTREEKA